MHTVHLAHESKNGFFAAAMGLMFSVNDHTAKLSDAEIKIIDDFFDSFKWTETTTEP